MARRKRIQVEKLVPVEVFRTAEMYHVTAGRLTRIIQDELDEATKLGGNIDRRFYIPSSMNSALASEVYLKCLHALVYAGRKVEDHDLHSLFKHLPPPIKDMISEQWELISKRDPVSIAIATHIPQAVLSMEKCIYASRFAFEKMRYSYEGEMPAFLINILPMVLRAVILNLKPEWRNLSYSAKPVALTDFVAAERIKAANAS